MENLNVFVQSPGGFEAGQKWAQVDVVKLTGPSPRIEMPVKMNPTVSFGGRHILLEYPLMEKYVTEALNAFRQILDTLSRRARSECEHSDSSDGSRCADANWDDGLTRLCDSLLEFDREMTL